MVAIIAVFAGLIAFELFLADMWFTLSDWSTNLRLKSQHTHWLISFVLQVLAVFVGCVKYFEFGMLLFVPVYVVYRAIFG